MTISKEINGYQYDDTLKAKIYMKDVQSERGCVPWQQMTMRYQKMGLVYKYEHKICYTDH